MRKGEKQPASYGVLNGHLWMEVPDIVQEAVSKTIPKKKKCKKAKWFSEEVSQTAEKREE